ncbi:ABC transporter ATP-binding protein [uncultured Sphaerochaeta sp.]|uniref:ABC transporter ATP-binding protein n=1 Tax=uncultured Sphaerochaeta sp. TaxID=886478 RepID=UPI002A0A4BD5|nr:ABC transporter ATP-binding protein [uncultured Sphaerochaeta sp.]
MPDQKTITTEETRNEKKPTVLLDIKDLCMWFPLKHSLSDVLRRKPKRYVKAVSNVNLIIEQGESLGLVGESGCGKSTLAKCIIRLYKPTKGSILLKGNDISNLEGSDLRKKRTMMQMIFQDPYSSLNPRISVYGILAEILSVHKIVPKNQIPGKVSELLTMCGLSMDIATRFPGEFSGGQRQRIGIARSLAVSPEIILADEPVSALDVSIQAQIINLLSHLQKELHLTTLFISHDLQLVRYITNRVAVMYLGSIVELGETEQVFQNPYHPYTSILIKAAPVLDPLDRDREYSIIGEPPSPIDIPSGCKFHSRCPFCQSKCTEQDPPLSKISEGRFVACHYPLTNTVRD